MLLKSLRSQQPANYFILSVAALLLWLPAIVRGPAATEAFQETPLFAWLSALLPGRAGVIVAFLIVLAEAFYLNFLINKYEVLYKPSFLPACLYILLMSFSRSMMWLHPPLVVNLFLLLFFDRAFALFKEISPTRMLFDCSFFAGLAFLFHLPALVYLILLLLALGIIRSMNGREWIVVLAGYFLPVYFSIIWFFWNGTLKEVFAMLPLHIPRFSRPPALTPSGIPEAVLLAVLTTLSLFRLRAHFYKNTIRTRSNQRVFVYMLFASVIAIFLSPVIELYHGALLAMPLALFIAYYFLSFKRREWIGDILFGLLVTAVVLNQF